MPSIEQDLMSALESFQAGTGTTTEEDSLLFEEMSVTLASIERDRDELHRLEDIRLGLESLGVMAGAIPRVSVEHVAFFQIAGNLATAGSDYDASLFFPSLESRIGQTVSNEGLTEVVKRLWQRIYNLLVRIAKAFTRFWSAAFDANARLRAAARRMKLRAESSKGRSIAERTVVIRREIGRLSLKGVSPTSGEEINKGLIYANAQLGVILNLYLDGVVATGTALQTALSATGVSPETYLQGAIDASKTLRLPFVASALNAKEYRDVRFSTGEVVVAPALMGGKSLFITPTAYIRRENPSLLAQAEAARRVGIRLLDTEPTYREAQLDYPMATIPAAVVSQIAKSLMDITDEIDKFIRGSRKNQLSAMYKKLLDNGNSVKNKLYAGHVSESDSRHYESALRFNAAFASWSENPHDALVTHLLGVCRAALVVGNKSLANHN